MRREEILKWGLQVDSLQAQKWREKIVDFVPMIKRIRTKKIYIYIKHILDIIDTAQLWAQKMQINIIY